MLIHFATSSSLPTLTADDRLAAVALADCGAQVEPVVWSDPAGARRPDAVVIRSCWDYHLQESAFREWIARLERDGVTIINPPELVSWNLHKSYIGDLAARGVPAVPTAFVGAADDRNLRDIIDGAGWQEAVVKPAVSLNAYDTWRVPGPAAAEDEERFVQLRSRGDVLVQRFLPEITGSGEWSLIFFGTDYSHAVRKLPRHGDFRVQTEHGGSVEVDTPPPMVIEAAARALAALPVEPVYCRIDGVVADGTFMIMEAECIDPVLYFAEHPPAARLFADMVMRHICGPGTHSAD